MRKFWLLIILVFGYTALSYSQKIAVKTNALYWATATPNLSFEGAIGKKFSIDISAGYNPFTFKDNRKWKHYLIEPELRYWLCETFNGHFFGLHTGFSEYNVGKIPMIYDKGAREYRYEGWLTGVGISYGYQWILGDRWNLEATIGFGYVHTRYKKYDCPKCGEYKGTFRENFFAPTKVGISVVYLIK